MSSHLTIPNISVIMPTLRHNLYIEKSIESVLEQTEINWELLIINDRYPDSIEETIEPYLSDTRIQYYEFTQVVKPAQLLDFGLEMATSPVIAYLSTDCVYNKNHLHLLYSVLREHTDVILSYSGNSSYRLIEDNAIPLNQMMHRKTQDKWSIYNLPENLHKNGAFAELREVTVQQLKGLHSFNNAVLSS